MQHSGKRLTLEKSGSERTEVIEAPPARDAARALATTKHIEKRVTELENRFEDTAVENAVTALRNDVEETSEMADSAGGAIVEAERDGSLDQRLNSLERKIEKVETKAENVESAGVSEQELKSVESIADEAATAQDMDDLKNKINEIKMYSIYQLVPTPLG